MALDKQKLLNDLGNVMNQLQGADCGCMGKLFSNPGQGSNTMPPNNYNYGNNNNNNNNNGYGCGNNSPCAFTNSCPRSMCGCGNPRKLYADTYSYLNQNLMKPVVQEVYNDLKSLTPENTVTSNPTLARQMGLVSNDSKMGDPGNYVSKPGNPSFSSPMAGAMMNQHQVMQSANAQQLGNMARLGPQIVDMFSGGSGDKASKNQSQMIAPRSIDNSQATYGNMANAGQYGCTHGLPIQASNPVAQYGMTQPNNIYQVENTYGGIQQAQNTNAVPMNNNLSGPPMNQNMTTYQTSQINYPRRSHGVHSQGIAKFSEMFPDAMKKDLGYDPMAIALQMNPANQPRTATNNFKKVTNDNKINYSAVTEGRQAGLQDNLPSHNLIKYHQNNLQTINNNPEIQKQQGNGVVPNENQPQLVFSAVTENPLQMGQIPQQQAQQSHLMQQSVPVQRMQFQNLPPDYETISASNKEPIYPVDTSRNNRYNTLGQSVEMLPADSFRIPEPPLPQTLSPLPNIRKAMQYSNVKSTVSKTSIMGEKPARSQGKTQLQHIYNQYKGSQSYTQQNIVPSHGHGTSPSEGKLRVQDTNSKLPFHVPVEKDGGDNLRIFAYNHPTNEVVETADISKVADNNNLAQHVLEANQPGGDVVVDNMQQVKPFRTRNGLQDIVQTKYANSVGWSFHGTGR